MAETNLPPNRSRRAAARDEHVLQAARAVFAADPGAPIAAVARRAGVGMSALYRRYASKDELLGALCAQGQEAYLAEARHALASSASPADAYRDFLRRLVAGHPPLLAARLAGSFTLTERHRQNAAELSELSEQLLARAQRDGGVRTDLTNDDIAAVLEALGALRAGTEEAAVARRLRLLEVFLDGLTPVRP